MLGHFWKIETPPSVFKIPKLKLGHFCFFNPPPPLLGHCPKFSRFSILMPPLIWFSVEYAAISLTRLLLADKGAFRKYCSGSANTGMVAFRLHFLEPCFQWLTLTYTLESFNFLNLIIQIFSIICVSQYHVLYPKDLCINPPPPNNTPKFVW